LCVGNQLLRDSFWRDGRGARVMPRLNVTTGEKEAVAAGRKGFADDGAAGDVCVAAEASRKSAGESRCAVPDQVGAVTGAVGAAAASGVCPGDSLAPMPGSMAADADSADEGEALEEGVPVEIAAYCQDLADEYGLTPREAEILALVALGRSAKYIADELQVSYNTTRTHIRHIYEKLNIHSKQELIDVVLFGSGVM
ncbi:MAG: helix-turn-helix transcriptional regulator, partial [Adlercreutzia sp.]|nr:helix-turn-helix transcriptional regulator [Adlercreutzia sp.]